MTKKERKRKKKLQMYNKRLIKKYYFVAPRNVWTDQIPKDYDYTYINWGWCKGWDKTFGMMYLEELGKAIKDNNIKNFRILEQKEKYGEARNYVNCYTDEIDNIINKYEHISRNVCMYCGCETPTIDDGWIQPICFDCYEKLYRRRMSFITRKDYIPDTDEKIRALYESCIIDEPDENGEYHIPKSYTLIRYSKDSEEEMVYDISDTVNKIQKRIAGYKKGEDKWKT